MSQKNMTGSGLLKRGTVVLITGGAGFLGSHLAHALIGAGAKVRVLDDLSCGGPQRLMGLGSSIELLRGDVRNPIAVQSAMRGVTAVVHLAGVPSTSDLMRAHEVKVGGALHILSSARALPSRERPRILLISSGSVYGRQSSFALHEELPTMPLTSEGVLCLAVEHLGRVFREVHGVPALSLRMFRAFGPDETLDRADASVVLKFIRAALDGRSPAILGDGQQTRDLIYIENAVTALVQAIAQPELPAFDVMNIGSGEAVTMNFLWTLVLELCGKRRMAIEPTFVPAPTWELKNSRAQIARACRALDWAPTIRLRNGLAKTIEHFLALREGDSSSWFGPPDELLTRARRSTPPPQIPDDGLILSEDDIIEDNPRPLQLEWVASAAD